MARKFRSLLMAAVLLLSFAFPSGSAYADGYAGVVYGPKATAVVNPEYGVIVNAGSSFDAALYAIGYNPDSSEFTDDVKAYLSNSDTGGAFYTFAQKFTNHNDKWGDGGFGGAAGGTVGFDQFDLDMTTSLKIFNSMYGPSNVWCGQYSSAERVAAVVSVGLVLSGEVGGGGGSTPLPDDGTYVTIPITPFDASIYSFQSLDSISYNDVEYANTVYQLGSTKYYTKYYANRHNRSVANTFSINFKKSFYDGIMSKVTSLGWSDAKVVIKFNSTDRSRYNMDLRIVHGDSFSKYYDKNGNFVAFNAAYGTQYYRYTGGWFYVSYPSTWPSTVAELPSSLRFNENYSNSWSTGTFDNTGATQGIWWDTYATAGTIFDANGVEGDTPVVPPTNWPEPDPTPTPQPPEVDPPTTPDPPNVPTTDPPTYPPEVTYPDVTYVEADLTAVLDALNEHCEHLQHAIYTASLNLYSSLSSSISAEFTSLKTFIRALASWNVDAMNANFDALYTYLTDFAVWLEGCIRADDIVLLLEGIYNQVGSLDASTNDLVDLSTLETTASDISADVELIVQALNNLQDDNELLTIRGYLKGMYDWLHDFVIPDAVEVDLSTVEGYLSDISTDLDDFVHDFAVRWADLMNELDDIIDAINSINFSNRRWWKPIDLPDDPTVIVPVIRLPPEYYDPTNPRLPPFIEEPDAINIPALQAAFMELMTKFPFCMLNDLLNMLLYVVRPAAAPVFDLPVPNPSDWSSPHMITIDLSIFDPCAAMLRMGITLWVGVKLARRSVKMWTNDNQEVVSV